MKFAFVTCVQLGLSCIERIYNIGGNLDLLITLKDHKAKNKSGRIYLDKFSEINNIPLLKVNHINDKEVIEAISSYDIDWLFIIGWSQIANEKVINTPKNGALGMHPTLLPVGRGRASIPWAIIKGLNKTGVTMFKIDQGVDTGDIVFQKELDISSSENSTSLYEKINILHEDIIEKVYPLLLDNKVQFIKQDETKASYWEGRKPKDGLLTLDMDVFLAERMVRALTKPYPGAFIKESNKIIIVWKSCISKSKPILGEYREFSNGYLILKDFEERIII